MSGCRNFATELKHKRFKLCGGAPNLGRQTCYPLSVLEGFVRSCLQKFGEKGAQSSPTFRKFNKIQKAQQNSHPAVQTGAVQPQIIYSGGHGGSRGQNSHLAVQTEVVLQWGARGEQGTKFTPCSPKWGCFTMGGKGEAGHKIHTLQSKVGFCSPKQ